ncbi:integrin [Marinobacter halotolerans]|uniref:integrin n=1 Tax=Marinobacter halotolerans TaxID=1569211 RepID=UPI0012470F09|nr:integrin [Marinobacter halotolerans]
MKHLFQAVRFSRIGLLALLSVALLGCGGGSGGGSGGGGAATPAAPILDLSPQSIKTFSFSWNDVSGETEYRLLENPDGMSGYTQVATIAADASSKNLQVFLPGRVNASYILQACNSGGCSDSPEVFVNESLISASGYVKGSNTEASDDFGSSVALAANGNTLAVGTVGEASNATGIGGDADNNSASDSGAVYVFTRSGSVWSQQAFIKASNTGAGDNFGFSVALAADGNTLAVGAPEEDSNATGIDGDADNNSASDSGAVYVFTRSGTVWSQRAYLKASNTEAGDFFGSRLALAADANTLAVGAGDEDSNAGGVNGVEDNNSAQSSGAVYVFVRSGTDWSQQVYLKASNAGASDFFGASLALAADGTTLAVGGSGEASNATGIGGNQTDNSSANSGAVYVFVRSGSVWAQQAYIKASNAEANDRFGGSLVLAADGNVLAVGATGEDSNATGIDGIQTDNSSARSGAVYVFARSGPVWAQQAYIKASNAEANDRFGGSLVLAADGNVLAVGATGETSNATGIDENEADNSAVNSGAVYVFNRSSNVWSQQAYVKAPNTGANDLFGDSVALAADGNTLAVGATGEDSNAMGIDGDEADNSASNSGAVYLY